MMRMRRSVSSPCAGISTCSGVPPSGLAAGMSCTCPSVIATTPASRARGMSASARSMAANSRVPSEPRFRHGDGAQLQVGQVARPGPRCAARAASASAGAVADLHAGGLVDHQQADIGQGFAGFLDQPRAGEPEQQRRRRRSTRHTVPRARRHSADAERQRRTARASAASSQSGRRARSAGRRWPVPCASVSRFRSESLSHSRGDPPIGGRRSPASSQGGGRSGAVISLSQPLQQRRHMHLVALVVAGQRIHHEVDPEPVGQRALPGAAGDDRVGLRPGVVDRPGRRPVMAPMITGLTLSLLRSWSRCTHTVSPAKRPGKSCSR